MEKEEAKHNINGEKESMILLPTTHLTKTSLQPTVNINVVADRDCDANI